MSCNLCSCFYTEIVISVILLLNLLSLQLRTYRGHTNEKNFVGLSVNSEYLACGSETNEVFAYHKVIMFYRNEDESNYSDEYHSVM